MKNFCLFIALLFAIVQLGTAQVDNNTTLFKTLKAKDSLLFDRAFNHCESFHLEALISEDFEFYHDQSGIQNSKESFLKIMKEGICNPQNTTKSRRELVTKSLEVFPLYNNGKLYGALQKGIHKFYESTQGNPELPGSMAKFSHLWILEGDTWRIKRVLSYDHKPIE